MCDLLQRTNYSGIERGVRNVSLVNIEQVAKGLKTSLPDLFSRLKPAPWLRIAGLHHKSGISHDPSHFGVECFSLGLSLSPRPWVLGLGGLNSRLLYHGRLIPSLFEKLFDVRLKIPNTRPAGHPQLDIWQACSYHPPPLERLLRHPDAQRGFLWCHPGGYRIRWRFTLN